METRMQFLHLVPSLPQMGSNYSQVLDPFCWRVSVGGDCSTSPSAAAAGDHFRLGTSSHLRARFHPFSSDEKRGQFFTVKDGHMVLIRHRMDRGHYQGNTGRSGRHKVRFFVDEATAHSSDIDSSTLSAIDERDILEAGESFETRDSDRDIVADLVAVDSALDQNSFDEQDPWDDIGTDFDSEIQLKEYEGTTPSVDVDYSYEDMKFGQQKNWSLSDLKKIDLLRNFEYRQRNKGGLFVVQAMRVEHMKPTEELLVDSFAELMGGLLTYRPLLALTVRQYVENRLACLPDAVTLVGLYSPFEDSVDFEKSKDAECEKTEKDSSRNWLVIGTVELSFSNGGHPDIPAGPAPPPGSPYLCNMAVSRAFRRQGLGRQLLKAAEDLAVLMAAQTLYLHCRMVDLAPLNMYQGAGYQIVARDSILSLLSFQRRRYLMCKKLQEPTPTSVLTK